MSDIKQTIDLSDLRAKWPSTIVVRRRVDEFSGGAISAKYLANLDSQGKGPRRFRVGRQVCYRTSDLVEWLEGRTEKGVNHGMD